MYTSRHVSTTELSGAACGLIAHVRAHDHTPLFALRRDSVAVQGLRSCSGRSACAGQRVCCRLAFHTRAARLVVLSSPLAAIETAPVACHYGCLSTEFQRHRGRWGRRGQLPSGRRVWLCDATAANVTLREGCFYTQPDARALAASNLPMGSYHQGAMTRPRTRAGGEKAPRCEREARKRHQNRGKRRGAVGKSGPRALSVPPSDAP